MEQGMISIGPALIVTVPPVPLAQRSHKAASDWLDHRNMFWRREGMTRSPLGVPLPLSPHLEDEPDIVEPLVVWNPLVDAAVGSVAKAPVDDSTFKGEE